MSKIIVRGKDGSSFGYEPTSDGYWAAQRKIDELKRQNLFDEERSEGERVFGVTQPSHKETGVRKLF